MRFRTFNMLAGSSLLALASAAGAQTTPGASSGGLEEVIVTARRVEERLQDVPISITVFNQDQLTRANITQASDLAAITPSLSANNNFGTENTSFAIRGFVQDAGTPPSVGTYFADVVALRGPTQGTQAGDGAGPGSFFDLQNVQILKGPQGTLFGRNTTGGAVLFVPQKPTSKFEGYIEASAGNYGMKRVEAAINLPVNDSVRFRLALDHNSTDGYLRNISGIGPRDYNNVDYTAVRASLVVDVTANLENYTILSYSHSDTNGSVQKIIACNPAGFNPPDPRAGLGNFLGVFSCGQLASEKARGAGFWDVEAAVPDPVSKIEQAQIINTTTWTANDNLKIKNIASYGQYKDLQRSPLFGSNWQLSNLPAIYSQIFFRGIPAVFTGIFPAPGDNTADQRTYTEELQLQGNSADQRLTYQAGAYFEWSDPIAPVGNQSAQLIPCADLSTLNCADVLGSAFSAAVSAGQGLPFILPIQVGAANYTVGETSFRDRGLYLQSSYSVTDKFKITAGLRGTWDDQVNTATRITNKYSVVPPYPTGLFTYSPGFPFTPIPGATCTDDTAVYPNCTARNEKKSSKPTGLIGLDYKPTDDMLLYGKYARGYRSGGVFSNAPFDHRTFDPEKVDSFELGMKTSFAEPVHGLFDITAFYNNFSNQQLQIGYNAALIPGGGGATFPVSPTTAILNVGKSRIYGAEIEASINPVAGLRFDVNYTYLNATIRSVGAVSTIDPAYQAAVSLVPGDPLALSPKNKAAIEVDYTLPLPSTIGAITVGATLIHTDKQLTNYNYFNPTNVALLGGNFSYVPSTDLLNLNLGWKSILGSPVDLAFFGTNVTNKQYYQYIPGLGSAQAGLETATVGAPRMYGVRVKYHFGK